MPRPSTPSTTTAQGTVSFNGGQTQIKVSDDETILLAGLRAGLPLPYECASGGCGTCKVRLVGGRVQNRWTDATGLSDRDRQRGDRILMCQSVPDGECKVRVGFRDDPDRPAEPLPQRFAGRLAERQRVTRDTAIFVLELDQHIDYLPGQFVQLEFPDGLRRAYSMTRPHHHDSPHVVELLIRAKPEGEGSTWLFERLTVGDDLTVEGPYGRAYAQSHAARPVVCIAGGTGAAPVMAIADRLNAEAPDRRLDVYVGARSFADVVFAERLAELKLRGANVVVSVDEGDEYMHDVLGQVRSGRVLEHLVTDLPDLRDHDVYLAGPAPMIDAALRRLVREGTASADRVFMDRFN